MTLLLLFACIQNDIAPNKSPPHISGRDSDPPTEDSDSSPVVDDSEVSTPIECPELPSDEAVEITSECPTTPMQVDWNLRERWRVDVPGANACLSVSAGRFLDGNQDGVIDALDPMQLWLHCWNLNSSFGFQAHLYAADGSALGTMLPQSWRAYSALGDIDPTNPGVEALTSWYDRNLSQDNISVFSGAGQLSSAPTGASSTTLPWLADLDGDGAVEALLDAVVVDPITGVTRFALGGSQNQGDMGMVWSADLDGDGDPELIGGLNDPTSVSIYDSRGGLISVCASGAADDRWARVAIGELDGDPEGEIVVAGQGQVVICDSDGTQLRRTENTIYAIEQVALGQLDADHLPEIVIGTSAGVRALDTDLTPLWEWADPTFINWHHPLVLSDLDGDGLHEVLVYVAEKLVILDSSGVELASLASTSRDLSAWENNPIVVDIDGDGLAEIVVAGANPELWVIENADGGFPVLDADQMWPGRDHFPGDRTPDGGMPQGDPHWVSRETNVWNGTSVGLSGLPDLAIEVSDLCVADCEANARVTVRIENVGEGAARGVLVRVFNVEGELLVDERLGLLNEGTATYRSYELPVEQVRYGVRATVNEDASVVVCGQADEDDTWEEAVCP